MAKQSVKVHFDTHFYGTLDNGEVVEPIGRDHMLPYNLLFGALASCFYSTFLSVAKKKKLEFDEVDIIVEGEKREEVPTVLTYVNMIMTIKGAKGKQEKFVQSAELGAKYCSIHHTISQTCPIELEVKFED